MRLSDRCQVWPEALGWCGDGGERCSTKDTAKPTCIHSIKAYNLYTRPIDAALGRAITGDMSE